MTTFKKNSVVASEYNYSTSAYKIAAFGINPWEGPWMNRQQILSRLGKKVPVVYSTGSLFSWQVFDKIWHEAPISAKFERMNYVWIDRRSKLALRNSKFPLADSAVLSIAARRTNRFLSDKSTGPLVAYVFGPTFKPDALRLKPDLLIYHAYDQFESTPGWNEEIQENHRTLIEQSDLVFASSEAIAEGIQQHSHKSITVVANGADFTIFDRASRDRSDPEDVIGLPSPRIGYVGNLNQKIDFPLIATLAMENRNWNFVFVGAEGRFDKETGQALELCKSLRNVHFLGGKLTEEVPHYIASMDINIMCYRTDGGVWARAGYPLKLHEYLAVGKPVLSSDLLAVREFSSVVAIANSPQEWSELIAEALEMGGTGNVESRKQIAKQNDWDSRVALIDRQILSLLD